MRGFLVPAIKLDEAEDVLALCHRHPDVWCALGIHPHDASSWKDGDAERLRSLLADPKAVAVGECGLDFYYDHSPREAQFRALREQWALAIELGLPVVVHNRESNEEMLAVVREEAFRDLQADFHSFAGGLDMARELIARGFYLGFTGMITFPKADNVREVLRSCRPTAAWSRRTPPTWLPFPTAASPTAPPTSWRWRRGSPRRPGGPASRLPADGGEFLPAVRQSFLRPARSRRRLTQRSLHRQNASPSHGRSEENGTRVRGRESTSLSTRASRTGEAPSPRPMVSNNPSSAATAGRRSTSSMSSGSTGRR